MIVGRLSFGLLLTVLGVALLVQNFAGIPLATRLATYWGAVPLTLGLELLGSWYLSQRKAPPTRVRVSGGSIAGLAVLLVAGVIYSAGAGLWVRPWGGPFDQEAAVDMEETIPAGQRLTSLTIDGLPGQWVIFGVDGDAVTISGTVTMRALTEPQVSAAAQGLRLKTSLQGTSLALSFEVPGWNRGGTRYVTPVADLTVNVPRRLNLTVNMGTGDLEILDMANDVTVDSGTGDVKVYGTGGAVSAHSGTGDIHIEGVGGTTTVDASTGEVEVRQVTGFVKITLSTGKVRVVDPGAGLDVRTSTGACSVSSDLPVAGPWTVETSTGPIEIALPRDSAVTVSASTVSGLLSSDLGLSITGTGGHKTMQGILGAGTYAVSLRASTGSVSVQGTEP